MKGYKKYFHDAIVAQYPVKAEELLLQVETAFMAIEHDVAFASTSSNPIDRRIELAGYFLALIKVLDEKGEDYPTIRALMISIANDYVQPRNGWERFLKRIPGKLVGSRMAVYFLKKLDQRVSVPGHPNGFVARIITDKKETLGFGYGVDILECGICKLFARHQYKKYSPVLCEIDYITSGLAGLTLRRKGTIANGAHKCDFRFEKNTTGKRAQNPGSKNS